MKVFITGGTGFVGSYLTKGLTRLGHEVTVMSRSVRKGMELPDGASFMEADPTKPGPRQLRVVEHDVIINLAGKSIFTLWTKKARRRIMESRVHTTRNIVDALSGSQKDILLLSASAVGYYGMRDDDKILDEFCRPGDDFVARVAINWESEAKRAEAFGVRVVLCRFGIVLGRNGGALSMMTPAFKGFLGSQLGSGKQWFPWIHEEDLLRIMIFLCEKSTFSGPVNCTAPTPVRNKEMTELLAEALHKPLLLPAVPGFLVGTVLGEFGSVLLRGQRAIPRRLMDAEFNFKFPHFREAVIDLLT